MEKAKEEERLKEIERKKRVEMDIKIKNREEKV